jgi:hypothetical protein
VANGGWALCIENIHHRIIIIIIITTIIIIIHASKPLRWLWVVVVCGPSSDA